MKKLTVFPILCLFIVKFTFGQEENKYFELRDSAFRLYESKNYLKAGEKYSEAFAAFGGMEIPFLVNDRYNAACSWALANNPDSAFVQLFKIAKNNYFTNYEHITADTNFNSLHSDDRWVKVLEIIKANKEAWNLQKSKQQASMEKQSNNELGVMYFIFLFIPISTIILLFLKIDKTKNRVINGLLIVNTYLFILPAVSEFFLKTGAIPWLYILLMPLCFIIQLALVIIKIVFYFVKRKNV